VAPSAWGAGGGGTVQNELPTAQGLSGDEDTIQNPEAVDETYTFTFLDTNGAADLFEVRLTSDHAQGPDASWRLDGAACSASNPDVTRWTCTDATPGDGILGFTYRHTWPAGATPATATQTACARDEAAYDCTGARIKTETTTIEDAPRIDAVDLDVYDEGGAKVAENWGGWIAEPGASLVWGENYLRARNTGTSDGFVDAAFTTSVFENPVTLSTIAIDGNIRFCGASDATTADRAPQDHAATDWTCAPVSMDGAHTFTVPAGHTLWITYELQAVPAVAQDGAYEATYTFS